MSFVPYMGMKFDDPTEPMIDTEDDEEIGSLENTFNIKSINGIFGMPYQFTDIVDPRIDSSGVYGGDEGSLGGKYAEKIVARMPILFLAPCKQQFLKGKDQKTIKSMLTKLSALGEDGNNTPLFTKKDTMIKYYSTEYCYDAYYRHVNSMCSQLSIFMGIQDVPIKFNTNRGKPIKIKNINWGDGGSNGVRNEEFARFFASKQAVAFYVDGLDSLSESFSNSTTESQLASTVNGFSDTANEIQFLLGTENLASKMMQETARGVSDSIGQMLGNLNGGLLGDLANSGVTTIAGGGKIIFPKIWQDSSFDRSYSFDIKLRSPDNDNVSLFFNIMVPFIHLLALVLPKSFYDKSIGVNPNGYVTPYLCRAYCKSMFNIDMGMITNMSVTRGGTTQWSASGIPTQMDISITIEDLYSALFLTYGEGSKNPLNVAKGIKNLVTNTYMMDYLSNLAGVNILDQTELDRKVKLILNSLTIGKLENDLKNDIYNIFQTAVANKLSDFLNPSTM